VPREIKTGPDGVPHGTTRGESAPTFFADTDGEMDKDPILEKEGFVIPYDEWVKQQAKTKKPGPADAGKGGTNEKASN